MLIERAAYGNKWRNVTPKAKAIFALAGFVAAYSSPKPHAAAAVALVCALVTLIGARIPFSLYLRVASAPIGFLTISIFSLIGSLEWEADGSVDWHFSAHAMSNAISTCSRSLAALSALLMLVLTTPLPHIVTVLRNLKTPAVLLDLMVLGYRMLFVFSDACRDTVISQNARLGFSNYSRSIRSLGSLVANLTVQVWQRSSALQIAAEARNGNSSLRFLSPHFANTKRDTAIGILGGLLLLCLAWKLSQ